MTKERFIFIVLGFYLKHLGKKRKQIEPKVSKRKTIIKIRTEINEIEKEQTTEKSNQRKTDSLKRSIKLIKLQLDWFKKEIKFIKIINEISISHRYEKIKTVILWTTLCQQMLTTYMKWVNSLKDINYQKCPEQIENLNRSVSSKEIELVIYSFWQWEVQAHMTGEFYPTFKTEIIPILYNFF